MLNANAKLKPASVAEKIIKGTGHEMSNAILYGVTKDGSYFELGRAPDVYDLLDGEYPCTGIVGLAVHTTGWAAPLNKDGGVDGQPSKHPERRRVALVTVMTAEGMCSALSFADNPDELITDENGSGQLSDALKKCLLRSSRQSGEAVGLSSESMTIESPGVQKNWLRHLRSRERIDCRRRS